MSLINLFKVTFKIEGINVNGYVVIVILILSITLCALFIVLKLLSLLAVILITRYHINELPILLKCWYIVPNIDI